ncbi:hypothetical protein DMS11_06690 [Klebsiella variicola]|nr:hypothetical protein DMS11_06690 [Klebsiella variicola]
MYPFLRRRSFCSSDVNRQSPYSDRVCVIIPCLIALYPHPAQNRFFVQVNKIKNTLKINK